MNTKPNRRGNIMSTRVREVVDGKVVWIRKDQCCLCGIVKPTGKYPVYLEYDCTGTGWAETHEHYICRECFDQLPKAYGMDPGNCESEHED